MRLGLWALGAAAMVYAALCAALYLGQRNLLYLPQPAQVTVPTLDLAVPGAQLRVAMRPVAGNKALLYFGGNAEDVSSTWGDLAAAFPEHSLYLMHYRAYGGSTGQPSEAALHADALALYERVRAQQPDVVVVGRSLGTGVAVRLASERPVTSLVLITPYDSMEAVAAAHYPWVPVRWLFKDRFDSLAKAPLVTASTTLIVAEQDTVIPRAHADRLLAGFATGSARMHVLPGTGHNDLQQHPLYLPLLRAAVQ